MKQLRRQEAPHAPGALVGRDERGDSMVAACGADPPALPKSGKVGRPPVSVPLVSRTYFLRSGLKA